ncbi:MAG: hypothetical protein P8N52_07750 [Crocinitomicaceae bacterium]|nr:hypothetical protein [Crocinitomicaceae bacterium]MDG1776454.1 hypothetical protein [Crocinitomicaceae bacterium]
MLSTHDIAKQIKTPSLLDKDGLKYLESLSIKYPYTQLFSILYLKGLGVTKDVKFEEELQKHSFKISARNQLYQLINAYTNDVEQAVETSVADTEADHLEVANPEQTEDTKVKEEKEVTPEPEIQVETIKLSPSTEITPTTSTDKLDETILHHAIASNYQLPELTQPELTKIEVESTRNFEKKLTLLNDAKSTSKDASKTQEKSFNSWIHSNVHFEERPTNDKEAIEAVVNDFKDFNPTNDLFGEVNKPKKEFFSPSKKAKESLSEDTLPVSETLAKIYAIQGNFPLAIHAYQQLSLNNPEKKIFFASLIDELQKKLNT